MLIGFAVLLSFSRGAWTSGLIASGLIATAGLRGIGWRPIVGISICIIAGVAVSSVFISQYELVEKRSEDLAIERISADDRFDHWVAGGATAVHYLPFGSGIGTYGFAHLPFKQRDTNSWYRNAHNQYLEVLTESGLIGIAIIVLGIVLLARRCWAVFTQNSDSVQIAMGAAGCFALVAVVCQSSVDFVITYPANLLTASLIFGAVYGCPTRTSLSETPSRSGVWPSGFAWLLLAAIPLLGGQYLLRKQLEAETILSSTEIPAETQPPTLAECLKNQQKLERLTVAIPDHASVWQRYAWWQLAQLRLQLARRDTPDPDQRIEAWARHTSLHWFAAFAEVPPQLQPQKFASLFPTSADQQLVHSINQSLRNAVANNPLSPQSHLSLASLAPSVGEPWRPWTGNLTRLSQSNPEHLYAAGLLYYLADDSAGAIKLWNRYLCVSKQRLSPILTLAQQRWDTETIATQLIPENPELLISMIGRAGREDENSPTRQLWIRRTLEVLETSDKLTTAERSAGRANVAELQSDWQTAAAQWREAVITETANPTYRLRLATAYLKLGDEIKAHDQATVARTLGADGPRLASLLDAIERVRDSRSPR
ncbi:O-antigen ligase family protein [Rosistilla oblonga]|uniref:O-antigen ligase family protein n=1 Tax=Rosistilla oblonga TaxID=2527990 RepID=UPI003A97E431